MAHIDEYMKRHMAIVQAYRDHTHGVFTQNCMRITPRLIVSAFFNTSRENKVNSKRCMDIPQDWFLGYRLPPQQ